jgi:hypothetical protein
MFYLGKFKMVFNEDFGIDQLGQGRVILALAMTTSTYVRKILDTTVQGFPVNYRMVIYCLE